MVCINLLVKYQLCPLLNPRTLQLWVNRHQVNRHQTINLLRPQFKNTLKVHKDKFSPLINLETSTKPPHPNFKTCRCKGVDPHHLIPQYLQLVKLIRQQVNLAHRTLLLRDRPHSTSNLLHTCNKTRNLGSPLRPTNPTSINKL